jgi:nicotinate phosphoribosyltransferase
MIISSLIDNDLYSFSVNYFYMNILPRAVGHYEFIDRNHTVYPKGFKDRVMQEVKAMATLRIKEDEIKFMREKCYYLPPFYFDFLRGYHFDPSEIAIDQDEEGHLSVTIEGFLYRTVFWEVPILAIISELYHQELANEPDLNLLKIRNQQKVDFFAKHEITISEFGTRRRYSKEIQNIIIQQFAENKHPNFSGTSNVYFAYKYQLTPIGTMSHQVISSIGALYGYEQANYLAMEYWQDVFKGDLGIFLCDTFTTNAFLHNFSKQQAKLFDGVRLDSGNEIENTKKVIERYKNLRIDPRSKTIVYSNALDDLSTILKINDFAKDKVIPAMGIGTYLTCDVYDRITQKKIAPSNMVIKLIKVKITESTEWKKCIKISDDKGKYTGDTNELNRCKKALGIS